MREKKLKNLQGMGDCLIADVASHVPDEIFFLVVPIDGANCCLSDSHSPDRRSIKLVARTCKTNKALVVVCQPTLRCLS